MIVQHDREHRCGNVDDIDSELFGKGMLLCCRARELLFQTLSNLFPLGDGRFVGRAHRCNVPALCKGSKELSPTFASLS